MNIQFPDVAHSYDHLIVHAFATPPSMDTADALWVDRLHRRKGWSGCGYNAVILRSGELQHETTGHPTRPYGKTGSHVGGCGPGWNKRSLGISMAGGVKEDGKTPEDNFTPEQYDTLAKYILAATEWFGIPMHNVIGHRDLIKLTASAPKACPCFSVAEFINGNLHDDYRLNFDPDTKARWSRDDKLKVHKTHTVQAGDTLWGISRAFGVPVRTIKELNRLTTDTILVGQRLRFRN